jgi:diguanylate cyclase (GGDEF)-like protein
MLRPMLLALQRNLERAGQFLRAPPDYARENRWKILAWPLGAMLAGALGWYLVALQLEVDRNRIESAGLRDVATVAEAYAGQVGRRVDPVEQAISYGRYRWALTEGRLELGSVDEYGLFLDASRLRLIVLDRQGKVVTSTGPPQLSSQAISAILAHLRAGTQVNFLPDLTLIPGIAAPMHKLLFARPLVGRDGQLEAAVLVSTDLDYFIAGFSRAVSLDNGLIAIVGDEGRVRALRLEKESGTLRDPGFIQGHRFGAPGGSALAQGALWFRDGRDRLIGWKHVAALGVTVVVARDRAVVMAPYERMHANWSRAEFIGLAALAGVAVLGTMNALRLARKSGELQLIQATYRMATEASNEGFYMMRPQRDASGAIVDFEVIDCNRRAAELVARQQGEMIGMRVSQLYQGKARQDSMAFMCQAMDAGYAETVLERPAPHSPARWLHVKLVRHGENLAGSARDISEERAHAEELERRSKHDTLTGLPNRNGVESYLPTLIADAEAAHSRLALMFVDLDGFKAVNDTWGHAAGDEALRLAAAQLKMAVRPNDWVARFGSDEFLVVLPDAGEDDAVLACEEIMKAFNQPLRCSYGDYAIGISIGISLYPKDGNDARTLLQSADIAMYSVKMAGKGAYRQFDRAFYVALRRRLEKMHALRRALARDEFVMYYQPRVRLSDGAVASFEALVRWAHPEQGLVSPEEFIPLLEESGLILQLGEKVIDKVCAQLAAWREQGGPVLPVSVNISPRQFNGSDVARTLKLALERHRVPPQLIEVELTESSVMHDPDTVLESLRAIQRMGIKVLVDDFGMGYSSLSQLYKLKFDGLKVDRAFVLLMGQSEDGKVIVEAIVTMARALGMHVVAEGVETMEQAEALRQLGGDEVQGYLISKPLAADEIQPVHRGLHLAEQVE